VINLGIAHCLRCGATSEAETSDEAISKLDHAVGRTRGINCGRNLCRLETMGFTKEKPAKKPETPKEVEQKSE